MFKFTILSLLLLNLGDLCLGHTNQICTSTGGDGSSCGSAKFFLTTYHTCPSSGQTQGQLHIETPIGNTLTFSFKQKRFRYS